MASDNELVKMLREAGMLEVYRRVKHPENILIAMNVIAGGILTLRKENEELKERMDNLKCGRGSE